MNAPLRPVPLIDAQGVALAEANDSFEDFFRAEHARLFQALCLVTGSRHEAEEVMQEAFTKVFERWDSVARMDHPQGFLYRVAMNEFRSRYRRAIRAARRIAAPSRHDDAFAAVEDKDAVVRALRELIPQQRAAIILTALLGYSSEEAGRMLGMQSSTVRALGTRARDVMRKVVGEVR
jgi:RNA polymerase sigma-70 factor, ECF subfamily